MDKNILEWLLAEDTPEVRLRTLKECLKLSDDDIKVIEKSDLDLMILINDENGQVLADGFIIDELKQLTLPFDLETRIFAVIQAETMCILPL